jgi:hypothetical protein
VAKGLSATTDDEDAESLLAMRILRPKETNCLLITQQTSLSESMNDVGAQEQQNASWHFRNVVM